jgi:thiol-disulfide isomerase/thioredoxin
MRTDYFGGKQYSLESLKSKIVVLNFWFTQCGGCITEMPELNELKKAYSGKDVKAPFCAFFCLLPTQ